ncbi:calcium/sodium antiporter [Marinihelvus fidelis]|uniref:Calcium/sodium antiporter n=1 Tax=Marinihelvus fidelis TaxID=2613842 RepID=A0A5N0THT2_9GAMM|nr:calcium/sodium antiporter [Marinihelvus fidelis]KAA9133416.1 calcium/sodium antiporter [Marinihelvus fidelis]
MLTFIIQLIGGFLLLVWAADRLVAGASATARNLGVSPLIIGLVIVGFGTSAPELVVSGVASVRNNAGLAVGNAIGSNIANMGLILGLTAIVYPLRLESSTLKREYPLLLLIMLTCLFMALNLEYTRLEGVMLLGGLFAMVAWLVRLGTRRPATDPYAQELEKEIPTDIPTRVAVFWLLISLVALPAASHFLVEGAIGIARIWGVSDIVIGLTVVAFGTSLPELATALTSAVRREDDLAVGNIIGSNMFNLLGVLGIAATIRPIAVEPVFITRDFPVMLLLTGLMFLMASDFRGPGRIGRGAGVVLLVIFVSYQVMVIAGAVGADPAA